VTGETTLLEREVYAEAEAARLLTMPQSTLHYWLEGGTRGRKTYLPIIRDVASGSRVVTWGEFVEAGLLRSYRQERVPMPQLRVFIQILRSKFEVPYPLAHARPWVSGRELLMEAQSESGLDQEFWLVMTDQLMLTFPGEMFFKRVTWNGDVASSYHPHRDPESPVVIDPRVRFGRPSIRGISTEAIAEQVDSGWSFEEVASDFGIPVDDVKWAHAYESTRAA